MIAAEKRQPGTSTTKLHGVLRICRLMNSERDLNVLLDLVAREAASLLDAERATIFILDHDKNEFWSKVALGSDEVIRCDAAAGIVGAVAKTGTMVSVSDAYVDPRFNPAVDQRSGYHTRNILAAPLELNDGRIVGVFEMLNKRSGLFTQDDEEILASLAAQTAVALQTTRTFGQLVDSRDVLERENFDL